MKLLIAADMEGISGVVNFDQVDPSHSEYPRFRHLMTADVNAAIQGASAAGIIDIIVSDGHWNATNILIEELDPRARLHSGTPSPFSMVEGIEKGADCVFFIGYHARMGTPNAILDHTWSSARVANVWLNGRLTGETGLNGSVCGAFGAPVLLITGDQSVCAEAREWIPGIDTVPVKQATGRNAAECLPLVQSQQNIREGAEKAIRRFQAGKGPTPIVTHTPITMVVEFLYSDMADRALVMPGSKRLEGSKIEFQAPDMPTAYQGFRSVVLLAQRS